jgi:hypothetical protein
MATTQICGRIYIFCIQSTKPAPRVNTTAGRLQFKDPAAVALGRKGGMARAQRMSAKRRKEIAEGGKNALENRRLLQSKVL